MAAPAVGSRWRYAGDVGLAAKHADALTAEMADLDLQPDVDVTVVDHDDDRDGLVLVEWIDWFGKFYGQLELDDLRWFGVSRGLH